MRLYRLFVIAGVLLCGSRVCAGPSAAVRQPELIPSGTVMSLANCIELALKNQPSVRQAAARVDSQSGVVRQARSRLLPDASVTSSTDLAGTEPSGGTSVAVVGSQLIFDFGRSRSEVTRAERLRSASLAALAGTKADVILSVKQAYFNLLRANELVGVFEKNLKAREERVAEAQAKLDARRAPKSDVLKAAAAAASARVELVAAKNAASLALVDLNNAMGVDVRSAVQITDAEEPEIPVPDEDQLVQLAIRNRPETRQAEEQIAAAEAAVKSASVGNMPALSSTLRDSRNFGDGFGSSNAWDWLLNVQWSPFDSGYTRGAVEEARAQLAAAQESYYAARQNVSADAVAARLSVLAAAETLAAAKLEVASAKEDLDAAAGRYQAGVGILLEVLDAQAALLKAEVHELSARYELSTARAVLQHAIGATSVEGTKR